MTSLEKTSFDQIMLFSIAAWCRWLTLLYHAFMPLQAMSVCHYLCSHYVPLSVPLYVPMSSSNVGSSARRAGRASPLHICCGGGIIWPRAIFSSLVCWCFVGYLVSLEMRTTVSVTNDSAVISLLLLVSYLLHNAVRVFLCVAWKIFSRLFFKDQVPGLPDDTNRWGKSAVWPHAHALHRRTDKHTEKRKSVWQ